MTDWYK